MRLKKTIGTFSIILALGLSILTPFNVNLFSSRGEKGYSDNSLQAQDDIDINNYVDEPVISGYTISLTYHIPTKVDFSDGNGQKILSNIYFYVGKAEVTSNDPIVDLAVDVTGADIGNVEVNGNYTNTITFDKYTETATGIEGEKPLNSNNKYDIYIKAKYLDINGTNPTETDKFLVSESISILASGENVVSTISYNESESSSTSVVIDWGLSNIWFDNSIDTSTPTSEMMSNIKRITLTYENAPEQINIWDEIWLPELNPNVTNTITSLVEVPSSNGSDSVYNLNGKLVFENLEPNTKYLNVKINVELYSQADHASFNGVYEFSSNSINIILGDASIIVGMRTPNIIELQSTSIMNSSSTLSWAIYNYENEITSIEILLVENTDIQNPSVGVVEEVEFNPTDTLIKGSKVLSNLDQNSNYVYGIRIYYETPSNVGSQRLTNSTQEFVTISAAVPVATVVNDHMSAIIGLSVSALLLLIILFALLMYTIFYGKKSAKRKEG